MTNPIIPVFDGHNDLPWESRDNRHYSVEGIDQELPQTLHGDFLHSRGSYEDHGPGSDDEPCNESGG